MSPYGFTPGIIGNRPKLFEAASGSTVRTIKDNYPVDCLLGTKINFQPGPVRLRRMGDRLADEIVAIGFPIDGKFGRSVVTRAYLGGLAGQCQVLAALVNFHLSQMKVALFVRVDDPDEAGLERALAGRRRGLRGGWLALLDGKLQFLDLLEQRLCKDVDRDVLIILIDVE